MDAPKCKVCGQAHWFSEPHRFSATPSQPKPAPDTDTDTDTDAAKARAYSQAPAEKRVTKLPAPVTKINPPNFVTSGKRGRQALGAAPMTSTERKRRSRAKGK